jgi:hypothetical protein
MYDIDETLIEQKKERPNLNSEGQGKLDIYKKYSTFPNLNALGYNRFTFSQYRNWNYGRKGNLGSPFAIKDLST